MRLYCACSECSNRPKEIHICEKDPIRVFGYITGAVGPATPASIIAVSPESEKMPPARSVLRTAAIARRGGRNRSVEEVGIHNIRPSRDYYLEGPRPSLGPSKAGRKCSADLPPSVWSNRLRVHLTWSHPNYALLRHFEEFVHWLISKKYFIFDKFIKYLVIIFY